MLRYIAHSRARLARCVLTSLMCMRRVVAPVFSGTSQPRLSRLCLARVSAASSFEAFVLFLLDCGPLARVGQLAQHSIEVRCCCLYPVGEIGLEHEDPDGRLSRRADWQPSLVAADSLCAHIKFCGGTAATDPCGIPAQLASHQGTDVGTRATVFDTLEMGLVRHFQPPPFSHQLWQTKWRSTKQWESSHNLQQLPIWKLKKNIFVEPAPDPFNCWIGMHPATFSAKLPASYSLKKVDWCGRKWLGCGPTTTRWCRFRCSQCRRLGSLRQSPGKLDSPQTNQPLYSANLPGRSRT